MPGVFLFFEILSRASAGREFFDARVGDADGHVGSAHPLQEAPVGSVGQEHAFQVAGCASGQFALSDVAVGPVGELCDVQLDRGVFAERRRFAQAGASDGEPGRQFRGEVARRVGVFVGFGASFRPGARQRRDRPGGPPAGGAS